MRCWRGYLSGARCKWFAYGPADVTAVPLSLASLKSRLVLPLWCRLIQVVLEKRQLNVSVTYYFARGSGCEVLWWVCLSVRLSVREDISRTTRAIFTKFFVHVEYVCGSVLLLDVDDRPRRLSVGRGWRRCTARAKCNLRLPCFAHVKAKLHHAS